MQKVTFIRTVKVAKGDGSGPTYEKGKSYWMRPESAEYWRSEDAIVDAAPDAVAENEPPAPALRPETVTLRHAGRGRYHVFGPNDHRFNDKPLTADDAEILRMNVLDGKIKMPQPSSAQIEDIAPASQPAPVPVPETSASEGSTDGDEVSKEAAPQDDLPLDQPQD